MSPATMTGTINGVDVERMGATVQAVQQQPTLANFRFRAKNQWMRGGHNRSTIKSFYGAGQEDSLRTQPFVLEADEPPVLLGEDHGANPAEYLLHALAACLTTSMVYHAAARGIHIESLESTLEGDVDLQGFLGLSDQVRPGYQAIRVTFTVQSDASPEQLRELAKFSPIHDTIANPVPVTIDVQAK